MKLPVPIDLWSNTNLYLCRHAASITNEGRPCLRSRISDPAIWLSPAGHLEAQALAQAIVARYEAMPPATRPKQVLFAHSSFLRVRQTMQYSVEALSTLGIEVILLEEIGLYEQDYGYFYNNLPGVPSWFRRLMEWLPNGLVFQGNKYLGRMIGGEGPADMEPRVNMALEDIRFVSQSTNLTEVFIWAHSMTLRVVRRILFRHQLTWYNEVYGHGNASLFLIADGKEKGFLHPDTTGLTRIKPLNPAADDPRFGLEGWFLTTHELDELRQAQTTSPDILDRFTDILEKNPSISASGALNLLRASRS